MSHSVLIYFSSKFKKKKPFLLILKIPQDRRTLLDADKTTEREVNQDTDGSMEATFSDKTIKNQQKTKWYETSMSFPGEYFCKSYYPKNLMSSFTE
jgi:hypothetical protein